MRTRVWIFALIVSAALVANLALLSPRVAASAEEAMSLRRAAATAGLKAQLELLDARLSPRVMAQTPELLELLKAPADVTQPMPKPDERALKAALGAAQSEPDLLIIASSQGAALQRKGRGSAQILPSAQLGTLPPLVRSLLEGGRPKPQFAAIDGQLYRVSGALLAQSAGAAVLGALVDDALASRLASQLDAQIAFFDSGKLIASSAAVDDRAALQEWIKHPAPGYGTLPVKAMGGRLDLTGRFPLWADRHQRQAALVTMEGGVQAAVSIPAGLYISWLGHYQALYLAALLGLLLLAIVWGLVPARPEPMRAVLQTPTVGPAITPVPPLPLLPMRGDPEFVPVDPKPAPPSELPWAEAEEPAGWDHLGEARTGEAAQGPVSLSAHGGAAPPPPLDDDEPQALPPGLVLVEVTPGAQPDAAAQPAGSDLGAGDHQRSIELPGPELPAAGPGLDVEAAVAKALAAEPAAHESAPSEDWPDGGAPAHGEGTASHDLAQPRAGDDASAGRTPAAIGGNEFSFAGLLDEAHETAAQTPPESAAPPAGPVFAAELRDVTSPGHPSAELLAQTRSEGAFHDFASENQSFGEYFPGDEPTRIEPVSAALLDKLREVDEHEKPRTVDHAPERQSGTAAQASGPQAPAGASVGDSVQLQAETAFAEAGHPGELQSSESLQAAESYPTGPIQPTVDAPWEASPPDGDADSPPAADQQGREADEHAGQQEGLALPFNHPTDEEAAQFAKHETTDQFARHDLDPEGAARDAAEEESAATGEQHDAHAVEQHAGAVEQQAEAVEQHAAPEPWPEPAAPAADDAGWPTSLSHEAPQHLEPQGPPEQHFDTIPQAFEPPAEPFAGHAPVGHVGDITLSGLHVPRPPGAGSASGDPDETHWRETFQKFLDTRGQTGEPSERLSYDKFAAKLRKNREDLLARHHCRGVRFQVYVKDGKAAVKASAIK